MNKQVKISGVVLAGGLARRMNQKDKGLVNFNQQAMITYALDAMKPVVDELWVNANRSIEEYQTLGHPIIQDKGKDFLGPLAGVFAALDICQHDTLLVMPCDSPFMTTEGLQALIDAYQNCAADIVVAFDGQRIHPVFMVLNCTLKESLKVYLKQGERKIDRWFEQHEWSKVDFSANPEFFLNINTLNQLSELSTKVE